MTYYVYPTRYVEACFYPEPHQDATALAKDPSMQKRVRLAVRNLASRMNRLLDTFRR